MEFKCDVFENDMGAGLPFRPGVFDGAVSISALQWLLVASSRDQVPERRIRRFFNSLQTCLAPGARAALQFYPQNKDQIDKLTIGATQCGFNGGVVVDYPNSSKARKYYLVIYSGHPGSTYQPPRPLTGNEEDDQDDDDDDFEDDEEGDEGDDDNNNNMDPLQQFFSNNPRNQQGKVRVFQRNRKAQQNQMRRSMKRRQVDNAGQRPDAGTRDWVLMKKAERRRRGDKTSSDSKYTMRRRKPRF